MGDRVFFGREIGKVDPSEIRKHADRLQIIRTWNFEITGKQSVITTSAN